MEPIDLVQPITEGTVEVHSYLGAGDERALADDVLDGLTRPLKELPPKHLYDARGSELFEAICELPEYYPTRTERLILESNADDIVARTGAVELVELGSGSATKTRVLLDAMAAAGTLRRYVPVDVSATTVHAVAELFAEEYEGLSVYGVVGDFERHLEHLPEPVGPRLVPFLGGTIGNFPPGSRRRFLRGLGKVLGPGGHLLLGTDLVKDPRVIEAAYDDSAGVTAQFNLNVLHVLNRELGANFDVCAFEHVAFYDREREWIEMRLRATAPQRVRVEALDLDIAFAAREELRTEISAKFTLDGLRADLAAAGLELVELYTDPDGLFAVSLARAA
ncbi:MAG: L-histidine Nalpha-methyltransferase [Solirubrobacteraceae bacterium]|jgi:L-histidine N-alpha-methyltransferase|nr:L-histidine Nalpha-methyltransferase [Solirubrobacteraceae bacterium]